jgi:hypothetical protein
VSVQRIELKKELILDSLEEEICLVSNWGNQFSLSVKIRTGLLILRICYMFQGEQIEIHSEGRYVDVL